MTRGLADRESAATDGSRLDVSWASRSPAHLARRTSLGYEHARWQRQPSRDANNRESRVVVGHQRDPRPTSPWNGQTPRTERHKAD